MANRYPLTGLDKFKDWINESASTHDVFNQDLINRASRQIETYCKRNIRSRSYTEYQDGTGKSGKLFLKQWPILSTTSTISIYDDIDRDFTSTTLFDSDDFVIYSERGIVELLPDASLGSIFSKGIQNVKAIYDAGYDEFEVVTDYNDALDFNEDGSTELNATLDDGTYTAADLATEIDTQLTATGGATTYTVAYNPVTAKFTITQATGGTFELMWNGSNTATSCGDLLGFDISAEDNGATAYTSDYSRPGVPQDIEEACLMLAAHYKYGSKKGDARQGLNSKTAGSPGSGSINYRKEAIPVEVEEILETYVRRNL